MTPIHIVAIGAHPDDIELSMAGLLIGAKRRGHRVTWMVATDGAAGGGGRDPALAKRRAAEAVAAAESVRAALSMLALPDGQLAWSAEAPAMIGARLAALAPDLVVTHALDDYHPDHRALARIVGDTAPLGVPVLRADTMLGLHFAPQMLVDISDTFEAKLTALASHESQGTPGMSDAVRIWNRFRGLQSGRARFQYAEAYALDRRLGTDPAELLARLGLTAVLL